MAAIVATLTAAPPSTGAPISVVDTATIAFDSSSLTTALLIPSDDNNLLIVGFTSMSENYVDIVPTSLTYGGQPLLHAGGTVQTAFGDWYARTDVYYLPSPPTGGQSLNGSVNGSNPGGFRQEAAWGMHAIVLSGAAQEAPVIRFAAQQNPNAPSSSLGGPIQTSMDDAMLVGFAAINAELSGPRFLSNDGVTNFADSGTNIMVYAGGYKQAPEAGAIPYTWITNGFASGVGTTVVAEVLPVLAAAAAAPKLHGLTLDPATGSGVLSITALPNTVFKLVESDDLDFENPSTDPIPLMGATAGILDGNQVTTDSQGNATVQFEVGTGKNTTFIRAETP